jgi:protein-S-isoprenylcysteine O-methyltransferase Ste14
MSQSHHSIQSYAFVGVQFACLSVIVLSGPWVATTSWLFLLELIGVFLGLWALFTMKLRNLSALPEITPNSPLQTGGPYRWIRHPMYSALLLATLALIIEEFSYWRGLTWLVLFVDLWFKLQFEEMLLVKTFSQYREYQMHTRKLIPWIL